MQSEENSIDLSYTFKKPENILPNNILTEITEEPIPILENTIKIPLESTIKIPLEKEDYLGDTIKLLQEEIPYKNESDTKKEVL